MLLLQPSHLPDVRIGGNRCSKWEVEHGKPLRLYKILNVKPVLFRERFDIHTYLRVYVYVYMWFDSCIRKYQKYGTREKVTVQAPTVGVDLLVAFHASAELLRSKLQRHLIESMFGGPPSLEA